MDELRRIHDAERLGAFAAKWYADSRPASRRLLKQYLARPLNAYRHEALFKRLFKLAERAEDDELMAHFLAALDRSVRRVLRRREYYDGDALQTRTEDSLCVPLGTVMPRPDKQRILSALRPRAPLSAALLIDTARMRLFSVHTRNYLRRRAWRYFRRLGKEHPERYAPAVVEALLQYTDDDVSDGLALLDNWRLMHALFHAPPVLQAKASGWTLAQGRSLAELTAAPAFEPLWQASAEPLLTLLQKAQCRPVRQWTVQMLRRHHPRALVEMPFSGLLELLAHEDAELSQLAAESLPYSSALGRLTVDEWLARPEVGAQLRSELQALLENR